MSLRPAPPCARHSAAGTSGASLIDVQLTYAGKTYEGTLQVNVTAGKTGSAAK